MEGKKTTARRSRRTESGSPAPASSSKKSASRASPKKKAPVRASRRVPAAHEKHHMVAMAAYFRAERRGFAPGYEVEDWAAAEAEIEARLAEGAERKPAKRARRPAPT